METPNSKNFPLEIKDVDPDMSRELMKYFTGEHTGFVRVGSKGYFLPHKYKEEAYNIFSMTLRHDDIFVSSFPRSGTTWTQELVWMVANDLDYAKSRTLTLNDRYPFLEFSTFCHPIVFKRLIEGKSLSERNLKILEMIAQPGTQQLASAPSPRFIKTHLPLSLLPPALLDTARMVYVARDPRDVAVSFYYLNKLVKTQGFIGDLKMHWNLFIKDCVYWAPYFEHLKEAWQKRNHPHMLFLFYEELQKDLPAVVRRVADFFDKQFTEEQVGQLCDHLSIENFKSNKSLNNDEIWELGLYETVAEPFIRKGKAGGWRAYFDEEMTQQAERWMADNLRDTDFRFPHLE